jgi:hypothetical protein
MGVQQPGVHAASKRGEPAHTSQIDAALATEHFDGEAFGAQLLAQWAEVIKASKNEMEPIGQMPSEAGGQHLGPAHIQAVQHLANGGAIAASSWRTDGSRLRSQGVWYSGERHGVTPAMASSGGAPLPAAPIGRSRYRCPSSKIIRAMIK